MRVAGPADVAALVETRVALFDEIGQGSPAGAERDAFRVACREILGELLLDGRGTAWVAVDAGSGVQGAAILLEFPRLPSPLRLRALEGYVLNVWVAPQARRRGIATALVAAAVAEARRRGHARIRLHSTEEGRRVYERLGFSGRTNEMELVL